MSLHVSARSVFTVGRIHTFLFVIAMHDDINLESFATKFMFTQSWSSTNTTTTRKEFMMETAVSMQCTCDMQIRSLVGVYL